MSTLVESLPPMIVFFALAAAYLIGSLPGSLLIGRLLGKDDPRRSGSGNAGATNALRTGGAVYGLAVLAFDLGKGVLAVLLPTAMGAGEGSGLAHACGAAVVVGHVYPAFFGFRGGKGAATLIGALLVLAPFQLLPGVAVWAVTLVLTGFVGLSTVLGMTAVALALTVAHWPAVTAPPAAFGAAMWLLIVYTHRGNLQRALTGRENRFRRAMLFRR